MVDLVLKTAQLGRLRAAERNFELEAETAERAKDLTRHGVQAQGRTGRADRGRAFQATSSARSDVGVAQRCGKARADDGAAARHVADATLSSIASASPFVGLFGTVWGIMQAFLRIGVEKSASLPVVAPAIGEALIATAVGLVAAIPATSLTTTSTSA